MHIIDTLILPERNNKPRKSGITEIMDVGTPLTVLQSYLEDFHPYIDFIKLGVGSAYITPNLIEKIQLIQQYQVEVWLGGTLFEKFYSQNQLTAYIDFMHQHQITWVEVSNGTYDIKHDKILRSIETLKNEFHVIAELGSKDPSKTMQASQWIEEINHLLALDCDYIILEGRESGNAGIYQSTGELCQDLIPEITAHIDQQRLIFEAPKTNSQNYFINTFGANVNLGNIKLQDILFLESQRQALRTDTFFLK
jgi:phosphosulfolactate synthase